MSRTLIPALSALSTLVATVGVANAQTFRHLPGSMSPANSELNSWNEVPFMRTQTRLQVFYGANELDGASAFTADQLSLRYDGPIPRVGQSGPFAIGRMRIRIGVTNVAEPDNRLDANLTTPLTTVFDGAHSYFPDPGSGFPEPWGGPQGTLTFPFTQPASVQVPQGSWLVVEFTMQGNTNLALTHALIDAGKSIGGWTEGTAVVSQTGCPASGTTPAAIVPGGVYAPGATMSFGGSALGVASPVYTFLGFDDQNGFGTTLPLTVPGTSCRVYSTWDIGLPQIAGLDGSIPVGAPASLLPVPLNPWLNGAVFHVQHVALANGANLPWGLAFSDKLTVTLGNLTTPDKAIRTASDKDSATSSLGNVLTAEAVAMRLRVQ